MHSSHAGPVLRGEGSFVTTRWSAVLSARDPKAPDAAAALDALCRTYWYPLYAYARRRGHAHAEAEDLTQGFFAELLAHNWVARADPHRGRFRSFLLMAMSRYLANEWHKVHALKRGGRVCLVPLPVETAAMRYAREPADTRTPEQAFEKQWALTLLDEVLRQLRAEFEREGKAEWFDALKPALVGSGESQPYARLATALGMSEGAVKVHVSRLRARYRERLREEIAHTVGTPAEVDDEVRHLLRVLARR